MKLTIPAFAALSSLLFLSLSACKSEKDEARNTPDENSATKGISDYLLSEKPSDAISISDAFANPVPGTPLVVQGDVMGTLNPIIENRAMLVLGDPEMITSCNNIEDDACPTPWDVCCDDPEVIKTSIATIQILGDDERPLQKGLRGLSGLKELTSLTVVGTVAEGSNADNLLINASGIHVGDHVDL